MKNDYTTLLKDIQQTIASFAEGNLSFEEALRQYNTYKEKVTTKESEPHYENYILNILATHNAKNFSIFSAIITYTAKENKTSITLYHGPEVFAQPLYSICNESFFTSPPRYVPDYLVNEKAIQNFTLYSSLLFHSEDFSIAFVAISSSSFFSRDVFLKFAAYTKVFISPLNIVGIISLDIPNTTLKYIYQVCSKLLTKGPCSLYGIYIISPFSTLSHFGLHSLNEVSVLIKNTLIENFGQYSFALSMNLYLSINTNIQNDIRSLNIKYKDITIPSKIYHEVISQESEIIPTITKILHFY